MPCGIAAGDPTTPSLSAAPASGPPNEQLKAMIYAVGWSGTLLGDYEIVGLETDKERTLASFYEPKTVVLVGASAVSDLDPERTQKIRALFRQGVPVLCEGGDPEISRILGLTVKDTSPDQGYHVVGVRARSTGVDRAHFVLAPRFSQRFVLDKESGELMTADEPKPEPPEDPDSCKATILEESLNWALQNKPEAGVDSADGAIGVEGLGAWDSLDTTTWSSAAVDGAKTHARFTVTVNEYKIRDSYSQKDWYLAETRVHHEVNIDDAYQQKFPLIPFTGGSVGWYVQERDLTIKREGSSGYNYLEDYGPTGTVSSGSVSISIGGGIATDPSAGITAGYSKSYVQPDVTMEDKSSLGSHIAEWHESFTCPKGNYTWYPIVDWPALTSKSSFASFRATIFRTTNLLWGVKLRFEPSCTVYKDDLYSYLVVVDMTRHWYNLGYPRTLTMYGNTKPAKPDRPSMSTPVWVNSNVCSSTSGYDEDGDVLQFKFDWSDGSFSSYGSSTQCHTYTSGGSKGVRARAKDLPHAAESVWSETFPVFVKALDRIIIDGPTSISERASADYTCTAYFNDGSNTRVDPVWGLPCAYASVDAGRLETIDVEGRSRSCTLSAEYTDHGITKSASKFITIENVRDLDRLEISGSSTVDERSSADYTCTAYYDDGSSGNVTSIATWNASPMTYVESISGGQLRTKDVGGQDRTTGVAASYSDGERTRSASKQVTVKNIKELDRVEITGPPTVDELSSADYTCTAYYDDGSSSNVTSSATWSASPMTYVESISGGQLHTKDIAGQDRSTTVSVSYEEGERTRSDTKSVTIRSGWAIPGDANGDCRVNVLDLIFVRNHLGLDPDTDANWKADVNEDGMINVLDLIFTRNNLGSSCP